MPEVVVDLQLTTGLIALQLGMITREAAVEALGEWSSNPTKSLTQILLDRGSIDLSHRVVIESLARELPHRESESGHQFMVTQLSSRPNDSSEEDTVQTRMPTASEMRPITQQRFRRVRPHAEGGLGVVFVAHDAELNREVAIKEIRERYADETHSRARFLVEAEITGQLEHPGIVPVYSLGKHSDGRPYYAMRFVQGETLQQHIDAYHAANQEGRSSSARSLEFQKLLRAFLDVCETIAYAHARGVIHRDIKPNNVMLGKFGETLVVDWGLAKPIDQAGLGSSEELPIVPSAMYNLADTLAGATVGTPGYMSPEQATGRVDRVGPASDLFSLGATLYCILTGKTPFEGKDLFEILGKMGRGEFHKPRHVDPSISKALEAICLKAMSTRPEDRYQTATDLATDLEHWLGDESVTAYQEDWWSKSARWGRKHKSIVRATISGLCLLTMLSIGSTVFINGARMKVDAERNRAEILSTSLSLDRALARLERGESARGMLRLAQSFTIAPLHDPDLRMAVRLNLGGWGRSLLPLEQSIPLPGIFQRIAFTPDGTKLVSACTVMGKDSTMSQTQLWDVVDGFQTGQTQRFDGSVLDFNFANARGAALVNGGGFAARLVDITNGAQIGQEFQLGETIIAGSVRHDGRFVVLGGDKGSVQVWDTSKGEKVGAVMKHNSVVLAIAFSPDGKRLLTGSVEGDAHEWDMATGNIIGETMQFASPVTAVAYSPDGKELATGSAQGLVRFWNSVNHNALAKALIHSSRVYSIVYNSDGTRILTGSEDNRARLWDAVSGTSLAMPLEHRGSVTSVAFSFDGKTVATGSGDRAARVWNISSTKVSIPSTTTQDRVATIAYLASRNSVLVGSTTGKIERFDAETLNSEGLQWDVGKPIRSIAVNPQGGAVAVLTQDGKILRYDPITGKVLSPGSFDTEERVNAITYSPDGTTLIAGCDDGIARAWEGGTARPLSELFDHKWPISVVAFHPTEPRILTAGGGTTRIWDIKTRKIVVALPASDGPIYTAAFSPDGKHIATGGEDNMARLWNAEDGTPLGLPLEHPGSVVSLSFSPDSKYLLTGSSDGHGALWCVITSKTLGPPFEHAGRLTSVAFDPTGKFVLTGGYDRCIRQHPTPVPVPDDADLVALWIHSTTGLALDTSFHRYGVARVLDVDSWRSERKRLDAKGGAPRLTHR
jgi:WD40 repeat protein/serine/threonine protein kinase